MGSGGGDGRIGRPRGDIGLAQLRTGALYAVGSPPSNSQASLLSSGQSRKSLVCGVSVFTPSGNGSGEMKNTPYDGTMTAVDEG